MGLDLGNEQFIALTKALGPGILRVGGTDQKKYVYDMEEPPTFVVNGERRRRREGVQKQRLSLFRQEQACECGSTCVLTRAYFESLLDFCEATGRRLVFGLASEGAYAVSNASALMEVAGERVFAYTFGNEQDTDAMDQRRKLDQLQEMFPTAKFAAPDTNVGPIHDFSTPDLSSDPKVGDRLAYLEKYAKLNADRLVAVTWHTYDFRAEAINATDKGSLNWPPDDANFTRFFDPSYLALFDQAYDMVARVTPPDLPLWLDEFNSVCHHGVYNLTDSFANSLWLAHRFGSAALKDRLQLAARQTLIGYQYALLNDTTLKPNPDYFTTLLARRLIGEDDVVTVDVKAAKADNDKDDDEGTTTTTTLAPFAFCSPRALILLVVSLDETATFDIDDLPLPRKDFVMTPRWNDDDDDDSCGARCALTSSDIELNGHTLDESDIGDIDTKYALDASSTTLHLPPLTFAFSVVDLDSSSSSLSACSSIARRFL